VRGALSWDAILKGGTMRDGFDEGFVMVLRRLVRTTPLLIALAGCADAGHQDSPIYRAGFDDGCSTASAPSAGVTREPQRNEALSAADEDYRAGWSSGYAACRANAPGGTLPPP
jgi:hypothetical protein